MEREPDPDHELQVARYLSAPVGNFWLEIARLVIEGMAMAGEKAYPVQPKGPIQ